MEYMLGWEVYEYSVSREWGWGKTNQCHPSSSWQYLSMYVDVLNVYNRDIVVSWLICTKNFVCCRGLALTYS